MANSLKITALNLDIAWKNPAKNFAKIEAEFQNETADVFLLPEMFSTGFCMDAEEIADRNSATLDWLKSFAKAKNSAVAGSVSVAENGKFYNRFYFVKPSGKFDFYDKRHLFSYSGEDKIYTKGSVRKIVEYKGVRYLLQTCYDLRFPAFSRNKNDYDAILYVANWPDSRIDAWKTLLKARAIENQAYVFGVNRIGTDGNNLHYPESSLAFFADGSEITTKTKNLVEAEISPEKLQEFRQKFPFLNDADDFEMKF